MKTIRIVQAIQTVAIAGLLLGCWFNYRSISILDKGLSSGITQANQEKRPDESKKKNSEANKCQLEWQHLPVKEDGWDFWEYVCKETGVVVYTVRRYNPNEHWMVFYRGGYLCSGSGILTAEAGRALCEHHAETGECF